VAPRRQSELRRGRLSGFTALILGSAIDTWATVGVAIGTLATVVYALFRDVIVLPRRRPKLELRFDFSGNDRVIVRTSDEFDAAYVRLRVANAKGKDTADDVVVVVTEFRRLDDPQETTTPVGVPLTWSGTSPPLTVATVHPCSQRHVDLLHVDRPGQANVPLQLDLSPKPAGGRDLLEPGTYEISIEVRARNADAACYVVPLVWDGESSGGGSTWDHLRVESVRLDR
jgi:hypothetical protein